MLPVSAVNPAIDWNVIAAAAAVFAGTLLTTIAGWYVGKKKIKSHIKPEGNDSSYISGAFLQDNASVREATASTNDLRDQILLLSHDLQESTRISAEVRLVLCDILEEMIRRRLTGGSMH